MGPAISKVDEDKALLLCRERRTHVRQALDGRCSLAEAHVAYIQALANMGMALGKLVDPEPPVDPSLYTSTSTSGTQYPITSTDKSASQFSNSCPSPSQHTDTVYFFSPTPSSISSERSHANCMKSTRDFPTTTVQEKPPISLTATLTTFPNPSPHLDEPSNLYGNTTFPATPPWDYFGLFHPIDNRFSLQDGTETDQVSDRVDDHIRRLREEEGIPELEEEGEKSSVHGKSEYVESEDDFDQPSSEPLVQIYKNRTETLDFQPIDDGSPKDTDLLRQAEQIGEETIIPTRNDMDAVVDETPISTPKFSSTSPHPPPTAAAVPLPANENFDSEKESILENKNDANKDFLSNMKEIEQLFRKASESGKEVPMMLEANTVNFRPLLPQIHVHRSNAPPFFSPLFVCFRREQETYNIKEPVSNEIKCLTWHRSASSISTSSHVPLHNNSRDGVDGMGSSHFSSVCMNSGSHASTLDRLYAWERKLYDEVKASGIVRKEYDSKCKRLRDLDSRAKQLDFRGENSNKIDRTRAAVKDLRSRIGVAIHRIDSISKTIEELRDRELQPQLEELIGGLSRMWETMLECHKKQLGIISTLNGNGNPKITIQSESIRQAAVVLEYELNSLCLSFTKWISSHRMYLHSINQWLHRCCVLPERPKSLRRRNQSDFSHWKENSPPIYTTCGDWLEGLDKLPTKEVADAIKDLAAEAVHFMPHPEKNNGDPHLSFSLSRKNDRTRETSGNRNTARNEAPPVNWSLGLDNLQTRLKTLIDRLTSFSENSFRMYGEVEHSISDARKRYENPGTNQTDRDVR